MEKDIAVGADADLVVFDINTIEDMALYPCYGDTHTRPEGIKNVIINGVVVVEGKNVLPVKPGKLIRAGKKNWTW